jgi:hypothetical protein
MPARRILTALALLFACPLAIAQQPPKHPPASSQLPERESRTLAPGVVYTHILRSTPAGEPWSIHVLEMQRGLRGLQLEAVRAVPPGTEMRRELPTVMAESVARSGVEVLGVVNGDFDLGQPYLGISDGLDVSSGYVFTTGKSSWPAMAVLRSGQPLIDVPQVLIEATAGKRRWRLGALNKPLGSQHGGIGRLFTRDFRSTVRSEKPFRAVVLTAPRPRLPLRLGSRVSARVAELRENQTEVEIPPGAMVIAEPQESKSGLAELRRGEKVKVRIEASLQGQTGILHAIGGFPILVLEGQKRILGSPGEYLSRRHPRTAVCYNDRAILFAVVDGRQPQLSVGMTLDELADLMVSLGCRTAMNTDGGGSSVMAVRTEPDAASAADFRRAASAPSRLKIVNSPSDGQERGRGNAWIIVRKR